MATPIGSRRCWRRYPSPVRGDIETLDLSRYPLDHLRAHLLLIHGRDDPLIPASESQALAAAVPPGHADVFIVGNLSHVAIHPGSIPDLLLLGRPPTGSWPHVTA